MMIKTKNNKAEGYMMWILVGFIVAIIGGAILIYVFKGGLSTSGKNVELLSSCKNQGGECTTQEGCGPDYTKLYKIGCPSDENEKREQKDYCCIKKNYG